MAAPGLRLYSGLQLVMILLLCYRNVIVHVKHSIYTLL
jgi:hypothetical protein